MTSILQSFTNSSERLISRQMYIDYCTIVEIDKMGSPGVKCHSPDHQEYYNTVSLKIRSTKANNTDPNAIQHVNALVLQHFVGNLFGQPYTPRVGDLVAVLFMYNNMPLVLGPVATIQQEPVMRAPNEWDAKYDKVDKWCQWLKPSEDENKDYYDHPKGKIPICKKLFHGPPKGIPGPGRDYQTVWDCWLGNCDPTCKFCEDIDSVPREQGQWEKVYSSQTESTEAPPSRWEHHAECGSYLRIESETGFSNEYSEGRGHIRLGNAVSEQKKRGHINYHPTGSIDIHSEHEETSIDQEVLGARTLVTGPLMEWSDSYGIIAYEAAYLPLNAVIRIYRDGSIRLTANNNSEYGSSEVLLDVDGTCHLWDKIHDSYIETYSNGDIKVNATQGNVQLTSSVKVEVTTPILEATCSDKVQFNTPKIYMGTSLIHGEET